MKRLFDIFSATIALIILSPLLAIIAILVEFTSNGPVLFCQRRVGVDDKEFMMYKFRTMVVGTPEVATDRLVNSGRYITKVGYYLRRYSLDELPQLLNIIKGDMSVVGPRPALYNQHDLRQMRNELGISKIRPGLTGWAQVNGRDEIPVQTKVELDYYYLNNLSGCMDAKILFRTVSCIFIGNG